MIREGDRVKVAAIVPPDGADEWTAAYYHELWDPLLGIEGVVERVSTYWDGVPTVHVRVKGERDELMFTEEELVVL